MRHQLVHDLTTIAIVGLNTQGLALAVALGAKRLVIGYDEDAKLVEALQAGEDPRGEISRRELGRASRLRVCRDAADLAQAEVFIITVPPCHTRTREADLMPLMQASRRVGRVLKPGDLVIYECTAYPGAVEELCLSWLAQVSGLRPDEDFAIAFSPSAPVVGSPLRQMARHRKVVSARGATPSHSVELLYRQIFPSGTILAPSIRVAEALQVMDSSQRLLAQALMNELSQIYPALGINLQQVLALSHAQSSLASSPDLWQPCLSSANPLCHSVASLLVDRALEVGYQPQVLPASCRVNDRMGEDIALETLKRLQRQGQAVAGARILVLGITTKPNCADLDGSQAIELVHTLQQHGAQVDIYDPHVRSMSTSHLQGIHCLASSPLPGIYSAVILAVPHMRLRALGRQGLRAFGVCGAVIHDPHRVIPRLDDDLFPPAPLADHSLL